MKRIFLTIVLITGLVIYSLAQSDSNPLDKKTYFGVYAGIGFINPTEINDQLISYSSNHSIVYNWGDGNINLAYMLGLGVDHFFSKNIEIKGQLELGLGYKYVVITNGGNYFNSLFRLSGGAYSNLHTYLKNSNSIFLGGGVNINSLSLSAFDRSITGKSTPIGFSFQVGLRNWNHNYSYEIQVHIIKGENTDISQSYPVSELSFTGATLKVGYKF